MRWKLLLAASLLATTVGAGASLLIVFGLLGEPAIRPDAPGLALLGALLIPIASTVTASIFVYRHTARRRPLQAMATALLSGILTVTALAAGLLLTHRVAPTLAPQAPAPTLRDAG